MRALLFLMRFDFSCRFFAAIMPIISKAIQQTATTAYKV
jgi:hypothetical protein